MLNTMHLCSVAKNDTGKQSRIKEMELDVVWWLFLGCNQCIGASHKGAFEQTRKEIGKEPRESPRELLPSNCKKEGEPARPAYAAPGAG